MGVLCEIGCDVTDVVHYRHDTLDVDSRRELILVDAAFIKPIHSLLALQ